MKPVAVLVFLAAAGAAALSSVMLGLVAVCLAVLAGEAIHAWADERVGSRDLAQPATTPPACPVCQREWRDLPRHLAFAHQEQVVGELP